MKRIITLVGIILFISFAARIVFYYASGDVSQKDYAKDLVKEELSENEEIDKYKILDVVTFGEYNIANATVMGLPKDNVRRLEIEVQVRETTENGIESEQSYYYDFFKLEGSNEWQYGRKVSSGTADGTQQYELEEF
ncbi:hypothetical protein [Terribacillus sp. AE2B 122]|uniref:hypothetical protein n=1 Tax=Terribacillus sp. AE2B 122 TaxID=1331902 RepID=UPI0015821A63|nr:hypothetical protein [Terribacillus sp. AE2B 122]